MGTSNVKVTASSSSVRHPWRLFGQDLDLVSWSLLIGMLVVTFIPYRHLIGRGYSDTDDFKEVHRALILDIPAPSNIFLTSHEGNRYRPVNRLLTSSFAYVGHGKPGVFLIRNLLFHLISVALVFHIIQQLGANHWAAAAGACLFGLHPANVNAVSVAVCTQVVGSGMLLWALYLLIKRLQHRNTEGDKSLYAVLLLLVLVTFSSELFVWVLPVFLVLMLCMYFRSENSKVYLRVFLLALIGLALYLAMRQFVVEEKSILLQTTTGRYGLRSVSQVMRNFAMFFVSSNNISIDYLSFFDPATETLPTSLTAIMSSLGLVGSLATGLVLFIVTLVGSLAIVISNRTCTAVLPLLFVIIFALSVSTVALTTSASETHLYLGNAFLTIAQILLLVNGIRFVSSPVRAQHWLTWRLSGIALLITILSVRFVGVETRNLILSSKAQSIEHLQNELRRVMTGSTANHLVFVPTCQLQKGYSIYGGQGIGLVGAGLTPFVQFTLANTNITATIKGNGLSEADQLDIDSSSLVLFVDDAGNMDATRPSKLSAKHKP